MDDDVFDACGRLNCSAHRNAMPAGGPWLSLVYNAILWTGSRKREAPAGSEPFVVPWTL